MFVRVTLTVRLADGELVQLAPDDLEDIYERLWRQTQRGSILTALKLKDASRRGDERLVQLNEQESAAFREALQHVQSASDL